MQSTGAWAAVSFLIPRVTFFRFYFKCVNCWGEITFKTDPKNHDYVTESGYARICIQRCCSRVPAAISRLFPRCTRNFEPWRIAPEGSAPTSEMGNRWVQYCNVCPLLLRLQLTQLPVQVGGCQRSSAA